MPDLTHCADLAAVEWRPIETAPKDGSTIIVWSIWAGGYASAERYDIAYWTNHNGGGWVTLTSGEPQLWMPLPPLPPPPARAAAETK